MMDRIPVTKLLRSSFVSTLKAIKRGVSPPVVEDTIVINLASSAISDGISAPGKHSKISASLHYTPHQLIAQKRISSIY